MSDLQIKITMGELDIFLQGEGDLVYKVFSDIRQNGIGELKNASAIDTSKSKPLVTENQKYSTKNEEQPQATIEPTATLAKNRKKVAQSGGQLLKDLDLSERNGTGKSLKDFIAERNASSNVQKTAAFVYYLQNILNIEEITIDHIFTCYKSMGFRMPNNLQQNLTDTSSSRYGYISRKDGKYTMTVVGANYVEFDMNKED